jgi:pyruvate-ferredoxin/flavodoxin oxidoreductase
VEKLFVMANPKYGSEKKGAPTNYYLTVAPSQIKVNCELNHVDVVLCCDPKAFTHTNPLEGLKKGGSLVWESSESPEVAWQRIPAKHRQFVQDNNIRVFILPGFDIARKATNQTELQLRMQGNSFLGAFFRVSPFLKTTAFRGAVPQGRPQAVREEVRPLRRRRRDVEHDRHDRGLLARAGNQDRRGDDPDRSSMRNPPRAARRAPFIPTAGCGSAGCGSIPMPAAQPARAPFQTLAKFDSEFRAGLGYHQPAGALASVGVMGAGTGATQSKYVARRETPVYIAENCTQCMECITACPDTALPNMAQEVATVLKTAVNNYVTDRRPAQASAPSSPGSSSAPARR